MKPFVPDPSLFCFSGLMNDDYGAAGFFKSIDIEKSLLRVQISANFKNLHNDLVRLDELESMSKLRS